MNDRALLFTTGSPFSRIVRIVLDELGLDYERREEITTPSADSRAASTPTLQVPTFWDGDVHLWESGLIVEYLLSNYGTCQQTTPPLAQSLSRADFYRHDRLVYTSIHTLGTSATTVGQMAWSGTAVADSGYLTLCAAQFPPLLGWLEQELQDTDEGFQPGLLSLQDIALVCHLGYVQNRPIGIDPTLENFPKIQRLIERLGQRASFLRNPVLWWEPGVTGYAADGVTPLYN